ncbi:MAG: aspartate kinase [Bacteroidetes bacterium]|nr:aspartate kinase [Bacteroidota bacterium]MBS1541540.1 aspartate kinase [Bacteroidota bacterium]
MKVFKFGGASLKDEKAIRNVASIIKKNAKENLWVVVSAMGGTTDLLERIIALSQAGKNFDTELHQLKQYHTTIAHQLLADTRAIDQILETFFDDLKNNALLTGDYDFVYDQVIGFGELLSSTIVHQYLNQEGVAAEWMDARNLIHTDSTFREGQIQWNETEKKIKAIRPHLKNTILTQGFIGYNEKKETVSLGREGSDFSAAIFGYCLHADSVTIWKDVPGVMSADPKRIPDAVVFDELPYKETAEMTYFGASVIHPKTVKPLANRGIPLVVKSFIDPSLPGTRIHECHIPNLPPLIVHKENQCLISCKVTDYTFINENHLGIIFRAIHQSGMHVNVMQNSAISFSFCVDYREHKVFQLIEALSKNFEVFYNTGLLLITVKNYDTKTFNKYRSEKGVILEQSSRAALQVLVKG